MTTKFCPRRVRPRPRSSNSKPAPARSLRRSSRCLLGGDDTLSDFPLPLERVHNILANASLPHQIERDHHRDDDAERDFYLVPADVAEQSKCRLAEAPACEREQVRP